jgi:hypothetical protein
MFSRNRFTAYELMGKELIGNKRRIDIVNKKLYDEYN